MAGLLPLPLPSIEWGIPIAGEALCPCLDGGGHGTVELLFDTAAQALVGQLRCDVPMLWALGHRLARYSPASSGEYGVMQRAPDRVEAGGAALIGGLQAAPYEAQIPDFRLREVVQDRSQRRHPGGIGFLQETVDYLADGCVEVPRDQNEQLRAVVSPPH